MQAFPDVLSSSSPQSLCRLFSACLLRLRRFLFDRFQFDVEVAQLERRDWRWRFSHETRSLGSLWKGYDVTNARSATQDRNEPVKSERDAAVGRGAVPEGVEHVTEANPGFFGRNLQNFFKNGPLEFRLVDTNRATTQLGAVDHDIVMLAAHLFRFRFEQRNILGYRRGKRMVA